MYAPIRHTVRVSDYEWFDIVFEQGKAISVVNSRVVWSDGPKAASKTMSARVRKIIEAAEREIWGNR